jgi:hypothetical protein
MKSVVYRSTNGRSGVEILAPDHLVDEGGRLRPSPVRGRFESLGRRAGTSVFRLVEDPTASQYAVVEDDASPAGEATGVAVVHCESLQSGNVVTLLHVAEGGVYQVFGYKRRSSRFVACIDGRFIEPSPGVLLDAGLVEPAEDSIVETPPAPPIGGALRAALAKAGLA